MTDTASAAPSEQDLFERVFPMPEGCMRCGDTYAPTEYSAWAVSAFIERFKGWQAARRAQPTPPAQEAQKPLAWGAIYCGGKHNGKLYAHSGTKEEMERYIADRHQSDDSNTFRAIPIYTAPQPVEREPLTDEQVARIARSVLEAPAADGVAPAWELAVGIARAIEAAHGIGIKKENGNG